jgi:hypothetical protein
MQHNENNFAKEAIIKEWDAWEPTHGEDAKVINGILFFTYLQRQRRHLLEFKSSSNDKWQTVRRWLVEARRVPN